MALFGLFNKEKKESLDKGLEKTREGFFSKLTKAVFGKSVVDDAVLDNLEEILVSSVLPQVLTGLRTSQAGWSLAFCQGRHRYLAWPAKPGDMTRGVAGLFCFTSEIEWRVGKLNPARRSCS